MDAYNTGSGRSFDDNNMNSNNSIDMFLNCYKYGYPPPNYTGNPNLGNAFNSMPRRNKGPQINYKITPPGSMSYFDSSDPSNCYNQFYPKESSDYYWFHIPVPYWPKSIMPADPKNKFTQYNPMGWLKAPEMPFQGPCFQGFPKNIKSPTKYPIGSKLTKKERSTVMRSSYKTDETDDNILYKGYGHLLRFNKENFSWEWINRGHLKILQKENDHRCIRLLMYSKTSRAPVLNQSLYSQSEFRFDEIERFTVSWMHKFFANERLEQNKYGLRFRNYNRSEKFLLAVRSVKTQMLSPIDGKLLCTEELMASKGLPNKLDEIINKELVNYNNIDQYLKRGIYGHNNNDNNNKNPDNSNDNNGNKDNQNEDNDDDENATQNGNGNENGNEGNQEMNTNSEDEEDEDEMEIVKEVVQHTLSTTIAMVDAGLKENCDEGNNAEGCNLEKSKSFAYEAAAAAAGSEANGGMFYNAALATKSSTNAGNVNAENPGDVMPGEKCEEGADGSGAVGGAEAPLYCNNYCQTSNLSFISPKSGSDFNSSSGLSAYNNSNKSEQNVSWINTGFKEFIPEAKYHKTSCVGVFETENGVQKPLDVIYSNPNGIYDNSEEDFKNRALLNEMRERELIARYNLEKQMRSEKAKNDVIEKLSVRDEICKNPNIFLTKNQKKSSYPNSRSYSSLMANFKQSSGSRKGQQQQDAPPASHRSANAIPTNSANNASGSNNRGNPEGGAAAAVGGEVENLVSNSTLSSVTLCSGTASHTNANPNVFYNGEEIMENGKVAKESRLQMSAKSTASATIRSFPPDRPAHANNKTFNKSSSTNNQKPYGSNNVASSHDKIQSFESFMAESYSKKYIDNNLCIPAIQPSSTSTAAAAAAAAAAAQAASMNLLPNHIGNYTYNPNSYNMGGEAMRSPQLPPPSQQYLFDQRGCENLLETGNHFQEESQQYLRQAGGFNMNYKNNSLMAMQSFHNHINMDFKENNLNHYDPYSNTNNQQQQQQQAQPQQQLQHHHHEYLQETNLQPKLQMMKKQNDFHNKMMNYNSNSNMMNNNNAMNNTMNNNSNSNMNYYNHMYNNNNNGNSFMNINSNNSHNHHFNYHPATGNSNSLIHSNININTIASNCSNTNANSSKLLSKSQNYIVNNTNIDHGLNHHHHHHHINNMNMNINVNSNSSHQHHHAPSSCSSEFKEILYNLANHFAKLKFELDKKMAVKGYQFCNWQIVSKTKSFTVLNPRKKFIPKFHKSKSSILIKMNLTSSHVVAAQTSKTPAIASAPTSNKAKPEPPSKAENETPSKTKSQVVKPTKKEKVYDMNGHLMTQASESEKPAVSHRSPSPSVLATTAATATKVKSIAKPETKNRLKYFNIFGTKKVSASKDHHAASNESKKASTSTAVAASVSPRAATKTEATSALSNSPRSSPRPSISLEQKAKVPVKQPVPSKISRFFGSASHSSSTTAASTAHAAATIATGGKTALKTTAKTSAAVAAAAKNEVKLSAKIGLASNTVKPAKLSVSSASSKDYLGKRSSSNCSPLLNGSSSPKPSTRRVSTSSSSSSKAPAAQRATLHNTNNNTHSLISKSLKAKNDDVVVKKATVTKLAVKGKTLSPNSSDESGKSTSSKKDLKEVKNKAATTAIATVSAVSGSSSMKTSSRHPTAKSSNFLPNLVDKAKAKFLPSKSNLSVKPIDKTHNNNHNNNNNNNNSNSNNGTKANNNVNTKSANPNSSSLNSKSKVKNSEMSRNHINNNNNNNNTNNNQSTAGTGNAPSYACSSSRGASRNHSPVSCNKVSSPSHLVTTTTNNKSKSNSSEPTATATATATTTSALGSKKTATGTVPSSGLGSSHSGDRK